MYHQQDFDSLKDELTYEEQQAKARRARRIREMKRQKARRILFLKCMRIAIPLFLLLILALVLFTQCSKKEKAGTSDPFSQESGTLPETTLQETGSDNAADPETQQNIAETELPPVLEETQVPQENPQPKTSYSAAATDSTRSFSSEVVSENAILIDLDSDTILAQRNARQIIDPASMTKVLTVLVAAEHITPEQLDDTFTMTLEITDYSYVNDCSNAGFLENEQVTVRDLFYGTILPSGADAAVGLATYVAGSHEAFVELMNQKLQDLGLSETAHVTNCVGLYNQEHYCTLYDMAMIMEAAIDNELCREVLGTRVYTTSATAQHPEGIILSNWFIRRIEDKDTGGKVLGAKTGYVNQSGSCAVSYAVDHGGKEYVCVTAHSTSSWRCIYDHVAIYKAFSTGSAPTDT